MKIPNLGEFLREDSQYSTMRIAMMFIIVLFIPWFVYVWVTISLATNVLAIIPDSVQWLIGLVLGAKAVQKGIEIVPKVIDAFKKTSAPNGPDGDTDTTKKDSSNKE